MLSVVLRAGVLVSAAFVLAGGIYFVVRHGSERTNYETFHGEPGIDRLIDEIAIGALSLRARSIIQFGMLLLIATPILRVIFSLAGFALERDRAYVVITAIVLCVLLYSLITGTVGG